MFYKYLIDERCDGDLDVVACLMNVDAIVHVEIALAFDWYFELVVDKIEKYVRCFRIRSCDGEVIDLTF